MKFVQKEGTTKIDRSVFADLKKAITGQMKKYQKFI